MNWTRCCSLKRAYKFSSSMTGVAKLYGELSGAPAKYQPVNETASGGYWLLGGLPGLRAAPPSSTMDSKNSASSI